MVTSKVGCSCFASTLSTNILFISLHFWLICYHFLSAFCYPHLKSHVSPVSTKQCYLDPCAGKKFGLTI
ncbi:hypothetical protein Avbf_07920 [Armadillidium vulgare]|nr:hypothetical protein Avbf_07920 [Armadillidium vulgare]